MLRKDRNIKVNVLQVDRCKPILGLDAFDHAPVHQHLEGEPVQGPVQDSQIQDWLKSATCLGYDEVRAVKPLPHLGCRDRLNCILCQEDSNLLTQDRSVPGCHRSLQNAAELGRSPDVLNHVAELNCACKPRFQMPCKCLQRHNQRVKGRWKDGSWVRVRRQRVAHFRPAALKTQRKRKLLFH